MKLEENEAIFADAVESLWFLALATGVKAAHI